MKEKLIVLTMLSWLCISGLLAQQAIVVAGGAATGSGGTVSYSVGQVAYSCIENANGTVIQGIQMPFEIFVLGIDDYKNISLLISVFPNPTHDFIKLKLESEKFIKLSFLLVDINGELLIKQNITENETPIAMETLPASIYFLKVIDNGVLVKTFKIIKN